MLDTSHCSRIIAGDPVLIEKVGESDDGNIVTSVVTRGELLFMAEKSERREQNLATIHGFLRGIDVYGIRKTADAYALLKGAILRHYGPSERSARRRTTVVQLGFGENDIWIAAIALENALTVVSSDSDFGRMKEAYDFPLELW